MYLVIKYFIYKILSTEDSKYQEHKTTKYLSNKTFHIQRIEITKYFMYKILIIKISKYQEY